MKYPTNLANYFTSQTLFFDGDKQKQPNKRKCIELPWQQTKGKLWDEVGCKTNSTFAKTYRMHASVN